MALLHPLKAQFFLKKTASFQIQSFSKLPRIPEETFRYRLEKKCLSITQVPYRHEALFCKMEDQIHHKLNVWIIFRAGSDEWYRKLLLNPL